MKTPVSPVGLSITAATAAKYAILADLHGLCFDPPWDCDSMTKVFESSRAFGLIARLDGMAAGFALSRRIVDESELLALGVLPPWRQRGIARALLDAAISTASEDGAVTMFLEVAEDNTAGLALYKASGFTTVGRRLEYYRRKGAEPCAAFILRRGIRPS